MIEIIGYFTDHVVSRMFDDIHDAIEFRDLLDANYVRVEWIQR
jgi:hypothetical protein